MTNPTTTHRARVSAASSAPPTHREHMALALAAELAATLDSVQQELAMARTPQAVSRSTGEEAAYYVSIRRRIRQALTHYHEAVGFGGAP